MERQTITVDIAPGNNQIQRLKSSQGDIGRPLGVYIIQNGAALDCSAYTADLYILKPDGNYFTATATVDATEHNLITWETAKQETPVAGDCAAQIRILSNGDDVGTARFVEYVEASPGFVGESSESVVESLMEYVRQAATSAETASGAASSASGSASAASGSASSAAQSASAAAGSASTAHTDAETASQAAQTAQDVAASIPEDYSTLSEDVTGLKSAITVVEGAVFGNNLVNTRTILSNNNTAITNNDNGTYTLGTTDYGMTIFGTQITLNPGRYILYGVPMGYSFLKLSTTLSAEDVFIKNVTSESREITISSQTACYLGYYVGTRPSSSFTITPYIRTIGMNSEITELQSQMESLNEATTTNSNDIENTKKSEDLTSEFISGSYIATNVTVGSAITFKPTPSSEHKYSVQPCNVGDVYIVSGTGGTNSLLWCFTNNAFEVMERSTENASGSSIKLVAPCDGYLIVNVNKTHSYSLAKKTNFIEREYTRVSDPHLLFWRMGTFSTGGEQGGIFTDRMYTTCRVKAGSTIAAYSPGGVNISFGYKVDDTATALDSYTSYGYGSYGVTQDCTVYIGVLYNTPSFLTNDALLDQISVDLLVDNFESKYSKSKLYAFGNPVDVYCEGQHEDTTGWTNATVDIDAVHSAFDTLVTASDGYMEKVDLGIAYDTYHMYQYTTKPVGLHVTGLSVPRIAIICCQHGNEKMSAYAMHYLMYDLIHNSSKNPVLSYLRSNCSISFIPIANPWGFLNTSRWQEGGVNPNRNWPTYNWNEYNDDTSGQGEINYKGSYPASTPEVKLMMQFLRNNADAIFAIDLHTNGTDTAAWYEISSTILCETSDITSPDYPIQHSYVTPAKIFTNRIKARLDENYGTALGNVFYGNVGLEPDRPTCAQWVRESNNMVGITYEVFCGSSQGYLGTQLTKYSPDSIKASAENLANFLIAMIMNAKEQ